MNDVKREKPTTTEQDDDPTLDGADELVSEPRIHPRIRERVGRFLNSVYHPRSGTKQELARDRTRSMALLIGGTVGMILLFVGVFSTPSREPIHEIGSRTEPNLGKRTLAKGQASDGSRRSVTPLLSADVESGEGKSDQLSSADIQKTSPRASADVSVDSKAVQPEIRVGRTPSPETNLRKSNLSAAVVPDRRELYLLNSGTGVAPYSSGDPIASPTRSELPRTYSSAATGGAPMMNRADGAQSAKSSIVFVRSPNGTELSAKTIPPVSTSWELTSLLAPGTRLVARLDTAATTAVKVPVVASIEYNYEHDGIIVVPAGTKALGDVQQASSQGFLNFRFQTLQMPDGREEKIEAIGLGLDQKPLKGEVFGKNTGKKLASRSLSGLGAIAAYVVGAGGGLTQTVTGETLLRDRLASNIALAGEQELTNASYAQNISVTLSANTRFYLILQKPAINTTASVPSRSGDVPSRSAELPTVQELRELLSLRDEINRMYQISNMMTGGAKP